MAAANIFAPRYAQAFASVAASSHLDVAAAQGQMRDFAATLDGSPELREVLGDPSIPGEQKLSMLDALAGRIGMIHEVRNLLAVIIDHGRLGEIESILTAYHQLADSESGVVEASVTSSRELNPDDRSLLEWEMGKLVGHRIAATFNVDEALIGGAIVRIGSTVYDGSVRAQLEQMKQALVKV